MFRMVTGETKNFVSKGGKRQTRRRKRRRKRSRQRGGMLPIDIIGDLGALMNKINVQLPKLQEHLTNTNNALQDGGKRKKKRKSRRGGAGEVDNESTNTDEEDDNEPTTPPEETQETQENPSEEPETCTGFSKMFGFCQTKDVKAEKQRMKECIAKCAPPQKTEEKQLGGKIKKSKKKRKRKNKSYKKRH